MRHFSWDNDPANTMAYDRQCPYGSGCALADLGCAFMAHGGGMRSTHSWLGLRNATIKQRRQRQWQRLSIGGGGSGSGSGQNMNHCGTEK
jgi:hypothetical protein